MNQHPVLAVALRAAVRRSAPLVLVALLALLGTSLGAAAPVAGAADLRTPASAPFDPANPGQAEETDAGVSASSRARAFVRPIAPDRRPGPPTRPLLTVPGPADEPLTPPRALRSVVLRC